ncbi:hypothetical protein HRG_012166 [Hirsutella rhossiliensis]
MKAGNIPNPRFIANWTSEEECIPADAATRLEIVTFLPGTEDYQARLSFTKEYLKTSKSAVPQEFISAPVKTAGEYSAGCALRDRLISLPTRVHLLRVRFLLCPNGARWRITCCDTNCAAQTCKQINQIKYTQHEQGQMRLGQSDYFELLQADKIAASADVIHNPLPLCLEERKALLDGKKTQNYFTLENLGF